MASIIVEEGHQNHSSRKTQRVANGCVEHSEKSNNRALPTLSVRSLRNNNPFVHRLNFSTLGKIQNFVMTFTLLPIRLLVAFFCLVLAWFFAFISLWGRTDEDAKEPLTGWRDSLRPLVIFWARCMYFAGGFHWVTVRGQRASPQEAPILAVAPHSSFFDSLPITFLGLHSVVAKTSAQQVPFFGTLTKFTQPVFVSREDPNSRHNTIVEMRRRAATSGKWPQIVIFPEGTCTNRSCLISFKPGAFIPGVPVQPVCIKYPAQQDTVTWTWCGIGALKSLYYTVCQFHTSCEIEFLPVYIPSEAEKKDAMLFARNVRAKMAEALGVPVTEHSYEDGEAMFKATELALPPIYRLVNVNMLLRNSGIKVDQDLMHNLANDVQLSGEHRLKKSQFANILLSHLSRDVVDQLFALYDEDSSSSNDDDDAVIDVRRCLCELYLVSRPKNLNEVLQFAFKVYDGSNKQYLTRDEMYDMTSTLFRLDPHGISTGHSFTFDDVVAFTAGLNQETAKALKKHVALPGSHQASPLKCETVKNGRAKTE